MSILNTEYAQDACNDKKYSSFNFQESTSDKFK